MRAIELSPPPTALHQALDRLYAACQLPPPVVLVAREVDDFTRLVRLAGRPASFGWWLITVLMMSGYAVFAGAVAGDDVAGRSVGAGALFALSGIAGLFYRPFAFSRADQDRLPALLVSLASASAISCLFVLFGSVSGRWLLAGSLALWSSALAFLLLWFSDAVGGLWPWLRPRLWGTGRLPLAGASPLRDALQPRLRSAIDGAIAQHGRAEGEAAPPASIDEEITAAFRRVWLAHAPTEPLLGRGLRSWQRSRIDQVAGLADPPLLVAAALAVDRNCLAATLFDRVAVALVAPEPGPLALPASRSEATGRALDALLLPWPYPMLARRLPLRWGEKLAAWLIDRERDPILRFAAIERMTPQRLFEALGREPADRGPEGELYVVGAGVPTMMLRVVDLVPNEDGSERVHWIFVPPHMVKASEAVAWTFGHSPGGYRPSMQS